MEELVVASKEQRLTLLNGYFADIKFDPFYKRWYYDLYQGATLLFAGVPLNPNTLPLSGITNYYLGCLDRVQPEYPVKEYAPNTEYGKYSVVKYKDRYWLSLNKILKDDIEVPGTSTVWVAIPPAQNSTTARSDFYEPYDELGGRLALIEVQE